MLVAALYATHERRAGLQAARAALLRRGQLQRSRAPSEPASARARVSAACASGLWSRPACVLRHRARLARRAVLARTLLRPIDRAIEPFDIAGLLDRSRRDWYPVLAEDLVGNAESSRRRTTCSDCSSDADSVARSARHGWHRSRRILTSSVATCTALNRALRAVSSDERVHRSRLQPFVRQQRRRADQEQRVERRVDDLGQPQQHLDERHENTTSTCPRFERTVVLGSVTMKKMNS